MFQTEDYHPRNVLGSSSFRQESLSNVSHEPAH